MKPVEEFASEIPNAKNKAELIELLREREHDVITNYLEEVNGMRYSEILKDREGLKYQLKQVSRMLIDTEDTARRWQEENHKLRETYQKTKERMIRSIRDLLLEKSNDLAELIHSYSPDTYWISQEVTLTTERQKIRTAAEFIKEMEEKRKSLPLREPIPLSSTNFSAIKKQQYPDKEYDGR